MAFDALLRISSETGISATTNSTGVDMTVAGYKTASPHWVRVIISAATETGAADPVTLTFTIDHSSDNSTWYTHTSAADQVATVAAGGLVPDVYVVWLPVMTDKRYIRLTMTLAGAGTLAGAAWTADLTNSKAS